MIRAVFWDNDGVLVDTEDPLFSGNAGVFQPDGG